MSYNNGIITAPVNTSDVGQAIGCSSHDVKTLCSYADINPWATYKPEATGSAAPLTFADRQANNFGLKVGTEYTGANIVTSIRNGTFSGGWTYTRLGTSNYGRLTDFVSEDGKSGYDHNVPSPFPTLQDGFYIIGGQSTVINCGLPFVTTDGSNLQLGNFLGKNNEYGNWYFCILLVNKDKTKTNILVKTATVPVKSMANWSIDLGSVNQSYAGEYVGVALLSSKTITNNTILTDTRFVGLGSNGATITLGTTSQAYAVNLSCEYFLIKKRVKYSVSIFNNDTKTVSFPTPSIQLGTSLDAGNFKTLKTFTSQSVASKKDWHDDGYADIPSDVDPNTYKYCRLQCPGLFTTPWQAFAESLKPLDPDPIPLT